MSQEYPLCRYCKKPYKLERETDQWWEFSCESCKVGHVFSKPQSKAAGRHLALMKAKADRERMTREWERARKTYSFSPTRTPKEIN